MIFFLLYLDNLPTGVVYCPYGDGSAVVFFSHICFRPVSVSAIISTCFPRYGVSLAAVRHPKQRGYAAGSHSPGWGGQPIGLRAVLPPSHKPFARLGGYLQGAFLMLRRGSAAPETCRSSRSHGRRSLWRGQPGLPDTGLCFRG